MECVRVLATVIEVRSAAESNLRYPGENDTPLRGELKVLTLDDGTSTINVLVPECMIVGAATLPGEIIECLVQLRQRGVVRNWFAKGICRVADPHAEVLRWMDLTCRSDLSNEYGYLSVKPNTNMLLRMISLPFHTQAASLEDLAMVLRVPAQELQQRIEDLQLNGQVYQNHEGNYVLL